MVREDKQRLLLLSPFFYPEMISTGKYNTFLVKALLAHGCAVDIVTSHPLYPDWKPKKSCLPYEGANISRAGLYVIYPRSAVLRRLVLELWFAYYSAWKTLRLRKRIDIVIPIFPPNLFMLIVNFILPDHVKKIGIIHDLQGIMVGSKQSWFRRAIAKLVKGVERKSLNCCDHVICLSESMRDVVVENYGIDSQKCRVHYPFPTISIDHENGGELLDVFPDGYIHVVYSGALGEKQMPELLLEFFEALSGRKDNVMCHLFSRGPMFDALFEGKREAGEKSRVLFHDLVPENMLNELYERSTIQIIPQAMGVSAGAFPSKLPNLLEAGVPVFAICDESSELADIVCSSNIGAAMHTWDISSLVDGVIKFIDNVSGKQREEHRQEAEQYMKEKFSLERLIDDITS